MYADQIHNLNNEIANVSPLKLRRHLCHIGALPPSGIRFRVSTNDDDASWCGRFNRC